jgi:4-aminobutyrate aminotransferase-like enzyme
MVSAIGFSPPLTFTEEHLDVLTDAMRGALDTVR